MTEKYCLEVLQRREADIFATTGEGEGKGAESEVHSFIDEGLLDRSGRDLARQAFNTGKNLALMTDDG